VRAGVWGEGLERGRVVSSFGLKEMQLQEEIS